MNTVNFFWHGNNFTYLNKLTILSHLYVGHKVNMWTTNIVPNNKNWISNFKEINFFKASDLINIDDFIKKGGNVKTASDLWRFKYLYNNGGLYCDTDAIAIKEFPKCEKILTSGEKEDELLSIGVIKLPKGEEFLKKSIENIKYSWGNVRVFSKEYVNYYKEIKYTHDKKLFYPYNWNEWDAIFKIKNIPDCYSLHLYHTMFERNNYIKDKNFYIENSIILKELINKYDK